MVRRIEVCRSPERSICEHLSKLGEQSQKVNRPVDTTGNQAGLLRRILSALFENLVQCLWWGQTKCGSGVASCPCVGRTRSPAWQVVRTGGVPVYTEVARRASRWSIHAPRLSPYKRPDLYIFSCSNCPLKSFVTPTYIHNPTPHTDARKTHV